MKQRFAATVLAGLGLAIASPLWAAEIELTTRVSGVVETVLVKPGQRVKKGAVLLRLDRTILRASLDEAAAEQARAQADADDARRELDRARELFDRTVSSTTELEAAALRDARARAALSTARARRGSPDRCRLRASWTQGSGRFGSAAITFSNTSAASAWRPWSASALPSAYAATCFARAPLRTASRTSCERSMSHRSGPAR